MTTSRGQPRDPQDPHAGQTTLGAGPTPEAAAATLVLMHGRGGSAEDILSLYTELGLPGLTALAPQAAGNTWYPNSFLAPLEANQPYLDSALRRIESIVADLRARGVPSEGVPLLGFSRGPCLTLEYTARPPRRYGAVIG